MLITVQRQKKTTDGIFGFLSIDTDPFNCFTVENLEKSIPEGEYDLIIDDSKRFKCKMPHIIVPARDDLKGGYGLAGIRIHSANFPSQLEGCIAVGDKIGNDCVDDSRDTFIKLWKIIQDQKDMKITVLDIVEQGVKV